MAVVVLKHLIGVVARLNGYNRQVAYNGVELPLDISVQLLIKVVDWLILFGTAYGKYHFCVSSVAKWPAQGAYCINKLELTIAGWAMHSRTNSIALLRIELMSARIAPGSNCIVCSMNNHPA